MAFVRPYRAVFLARFVLLLQYRAAAFAGFATQCWWGIVKIMVLAAFYAPAGAQPLSLSQAVTYTWLGQAFLAVLPWNADPEIVEMMRSGNVAYERLRPVDTYGFWYARALARRTAPALLRAVPMFVTAGVLLPAFGLRAWSMQPPADPIAAVVFVLSMLTVVLLSATISVLIDLSVVATKSSRGINTLAVPLVTVLSGMIIPLPLFPDWMQPLLFVQPFAGLVDIPYRIYFGHLAGPAALAGLLQQAAWTVAIVLVGRRLMRRAMDRLDVQGG